MRLLGQMTLRPETLDAASVRTVLDLGVTREALRQALHVAYLFNVYDRLADTLGWHVPPVDGGSYEAGAKMLLSRGYA